ncbi:PTS sugar transporter subunit IIA [Halomicrococcus sp. NG-SE-24]|uniref:PTS sugar transporter subunit IIA n=1 Tax=Halomicrococcus sp. NG-SE-24 TaxID=3436928 RepID=UPI003D99B95F
MQGHDLDELLPPEHVELTEPPTEKERAIEHLLDVLVDAGRVTDREQALDDLLAREEEATTGVGHGIGIPHAKTEAVERPSLAFTRSSEGVDFDAMDGEPATLLFMILVPEDADDDHLEVLSSLSRALMHDELRETLRAASSAEAVRDALLDELTEVA